MEQSSTGINALDLIPSRELTEDDFTAAEIKMEANFGIEFSREKFNTVVELIADEGWSAERFNRTVKWFLKHKRFPAWTAADWFDYGVKLYPHSWYMSECHKTGNPKIHLQMDVYRINGKAFYRYKDGDNEPLPFEKIG